MLFAIVAAWLAYRKAKESNRNPFLWAGIAVAVFIGTQIVVGLGAGVIIGAGIAAGRWTENTFERFEMLINLIAILASFATTFALLHFISPASPAEDYSAPPPPPNDLDRNN
jgi:hypothetical protein